ncbi:MAG: hypothetical protein ABL911_00515 [Gallionella sp.]|nr:hypothetical protein [Gallionella sp.]
MINSIDARVEFSFKGETYDLVSHIDLDELLSQHNDFPLLYERLAREHHIDTISYLYEVMQETEIEFNNAQGIAADFLQDGVFDTDRFSRHWQEQQLVKLLQPIAQRELNITDLSQNQDIKNALVQAYKLGRGL